MAIKTIDELKAYFETGEKPTQSQFHDWLESFIHSTDPKLQQLIENIDVENGNLKLKSESGELIAQVSLAHLGVQMSNSTIFINELLKKLPTKGFLDFTGRYNLYTDNRWVGTNPSYGQATYSNYYNHGTGEKPNVRWNSLGIGFLPKGTILHQLEFIGRVNSTQVKDIQVHLSYQGTKFDDGGYDSTAEAENKEIIAPKSIGSSAPNLADMQRHIVDLDNYILKEDGIIEFCCRPKGELTATRYWMAQRRLHYTTP